MLDPLSAISLASAIIQFVDFGSKILVTGYETYHNVSGATQEHVDLEELTQSLYKFQDNLATPTRSNSSATQDSDQTLLEELARRCSHLAGDLLILLEDLKVKEQGFLRTWDSFRQACRSVWKKKRIQGLEKLLESIGWQINSRLLYMIRGNTSAMSKHLRDLQNTCHHMGVELQKDINDARAALLATLEEQSRAINNLNTNLTDSLSRTQQSHTDAGKAYYASLQSVPAQLQNLAREAERVNRSQQILRSLLFDDIKAREEQIHEAYNQTFNWIFEDDKSPFRTWLASSSEIFWVSGKAGSGKSTLMKFLVNHGQTKNILRSWAGSQRLVCASYFFWNSGTITQRSHLGLMQSLLYQVLRQCPELIPFASTRRWDEGESLDIRFDAWSRAEVSSAIRNIMSQGQLRSRFCFFIDGLDEYADEAAGDHYQLIQDLDSLARSTEVKLCVSSRPWTVFADHYQNKDDLHFVLQDLTSEDMYKYVKGMLAEDKRFRDLATREPQAIDLVAQVRDRAEGVFLWVFLVVRSLLKGLNQHDDTHELERRLAEIPSSLDAYFRKIFDSIEPCYRQEATRAFQLAAIYMPLPLWVFLHIPQELSDPEYAVKAVITQIDASGVNAMRKKAQDNVNKWCRDLLEVKGTARLKQFHNAPYADLKADSFVDECVLFLHRTVRDFLLMREMQDRLRMLSNCRTSPQKAICSFHLAVLKTTEKPISSFTINDIGYMENEVEHVLHWAKQCEEFDGTPASEIFCDLEKTMQSVHEQAGKSQALPWRHPSNLIDSAVDHDLRLTVSLRLVSNPTDSSMRTRLLHRALVYSSDDYQRTEMVDILLEHGADPNAPWESSHRASAAARNATVWQSFMAHCWGEDSDATLKSAESMILHGADPDAKFYLNFEPFESGVQGFLLRRGQTIGDETAEYWRLRVEKLLDEARAKKAERQSKSPTKMSRKPAKKSGRLALRANLKRLLTVTSRSKP
ncbi:hypothetical protein Q7P37_005887 [Cladosporium fusiforme]